MTNILQYIFSISYDLKVIQHIIIPKFIFIILLIEIIWLSIRFIYNKSSKNLLIITLINIKYPNNPITLKNSDESLVDYYFRTYICGFILYTISVILIIIYIVFIKTINIIICWCTIVYIFKQYHDFITKIKNLKE